MTPIQKAALACGVKSNPPIVHTTYFPKPSNRIVFFENNSKSQYKYSQDLIATLSPILSKNNILLTQPQIGNDTLLRGAHHILNINLPQIHSLISQSELVVSTMPYTVEVAKSFGIKSLLLRDKSPPWISSQNHEIWSPEGLNQIFEESIIHNILNQLNIQDPIMNRDVFYRGSQFNNKTVEIVPATGANYSRFKNAGINIRADWHHDEKAIIELLDISPSSLVVSEEVSDKVLSHPNLKQINIELSDDIPESFIDRVKIKGLKLHLFTTAKPQLFGYRLKYIDDIVHLEESKSKEDLGIDFNKKMCYTSRYKSSKIIFHKDKAYPSKAAYFEKLHIRSQDEKDFQVIQSKDFYSEIEHFKIYNQ